MNKKIKRVLLFSAIALLITGCGSSSSSTNSNSTKTESILDTADLFTDRDLEQTVETNDAVKYEVGDNNNINITEAGTYVITGTASNVTISVNVSSEDKVQLVLQDLNIINDNTSCIFVKSADKVFVTTIGKNNLTVTGEFTEIDSINADAVIFSKDDLVLNGTGSLEINSTDNGITSKDDLKITGGTITINCQSDGLEANDSIAIYDGSISISTKKDGLHAEYSDDDSKGYVYISGGTLNINAEDDGIHATTVVQIDGGNITITGHEGIEGTYIQINDGTITISASDDGINATSSSSSYTPTAMINGGTLTINMGQGDTDGIDSNGNLYINGGTITITGQSPFDYDGEAVYTDGTIIINGEKTTTITNQFSGGQGGNQGRRR